MRLGRGPESFVKVSKLRTRKGNIDVSKRRGGSNDERNFGPSFIAAPSSINMASRGRDTARFDTQYPECYGLRKRERD